MPTRLTLHHRHTMTISTARVSPLGSQSCFIAIWALVEKISSLVCCSGLKHGGYEISFAIHVSHFSQWANFYKNLPFCPHTLHQCEWSALFPRGPTFLFEDWKQMIINEDVVSLEHLVQVFLTYILTVHIFRMVWNIQVAPKFFGSTCKCATC